MTLTEALDGIDEMFGGAFGDAGAEVVIEEFMEGEEASFFVLTDGDGCALPIGTAQDHKRVGDGDTGPNTGGMGAYSPAPVLTPAIQAQAMAEIVKPHHGRDGAARHPLSGRALCRADDQGRAARGWSNTTAASAIRNVRC
jgi:phosphoribosylamine---glycine ligase